MRLRQDSPAPLYTASSPPSPTTDARPSLFSPGAASPLAAGSPLSSPRYPLRPPPASAGSEGLPASDTPEQRRARAWQQNPVLRRLARLDIPGFDPAEMVPPGRLEERKEEHRPGGRTLSPSGELDPPVCGSPDAYSPVAGSVASVAGSLFGSPIRNPDALSPTSARRGSESGARYFGDPARARQTALLLFFIGVAVVAAMKTARPTEAAFAAYIQRHPKRQCGTASHSWVEALLRVLYLPARQYETVALDTIAVATSGGETFAGFGGMWFGLPGPVTLAAVVAQSVMCAVALKRGAASPPVTRDFVEVAVGGAALLAVSAAGGWSVYCAAPEGTSEQFAVAMSVGISVLVSAGLEDARVWLWRGLLLAAFAVCGIVVVVGPVRLHGAVVAAASVAAVQALAGVKHSDLLAWSASASCGGCVGCMLLYSLQRPV
eukprot:TRINITY_DN5574_c0_g1_i4.p1 TRINITY_DN5574_c0_g1~~TRINITY_DN5574_c0_g1_i4.p1  ORF type:complete len:434 (+),score=88.43 TRINITY_DN5574_c0_g1_i4:656-1957(+)